jgi:hypothetical protein
MFALLALLAAQPIAIDIDDNACFDAASVVVDVKARVGVDNVVDSAARVAVVDVDDDTAVVRLSVDGVARGARTFAGTCEGRRAGVVMALVLIVDPLFVEPAPAPPPAPPPPASPPLPLRASTTTTTPTGVPLRVAAHLWTGIGAGHAPGLGSGSAARLMVGSGVVDVGLGVRVDVPRTLVLSGNQRLDAAAALGLVDVCGHVDVAAGAALCATVEAGAMRVQGFGFSRREATVAQSVAAGAAVVVDAIDIAGVRLSQRFSLTAPVLRANLKAADGATVWSSPDVAFLWTVGVGVGVGG